MTIVLDDPYSTLGVSSTASAKDIKKAYRQLALKVHPDKRVGAGDADATFRKAREAFEHLTDDEWRKSYDASPMWTRFVSSLTAPSVEKTMGMGMVDGKNARVQRCLQASLKEEEKEDEAETEAAAAEEAVEPSDKVQAAAAASAAAAKAAATKAKSVSTKAWQRSRATWKCLRSKEGSPPDEEGVHWWQAITSTFLHFNAVHLLFNSWRLWRFGQVVETRLGQRAFVATFVLGGAMGNVLFAVVDGRAHVSCCQLLLSAFVKAPQWPATRCCGLLLWPAACDSPAAAAAACDSPAAAVAALLSAACMLAACIFLLPAYSCCLHACCLHACYLHACPLPTARFLSPRTGWSDRQHLRTQRCRIRRAVGLDGGVACSGEPEAASVIPL